MAPERLDLFVYRHKAGILLCCWATLRDVIDVKTKGFTESIILSVESWCLRQIFFYAQTDHKDQILIQQKSAYGALGGHSNYFYYWIVFLRKKQKQTNKRENCNMVLWRLYSIFYFPNFSTMECFWKRNKNRNKQKDKI